MRLWFFVLSSWWLLGLASFAAPALKLDTLTVGSTTYRQVTVLGANTTDLYFTHAGGIANVKLRYLSPELQKRFHYDPKAAAAVEQNQAAEAVKYEHNLASNLWVRVHQAAQAAAQRARHAALTSEANLADPVAETSLLGKRLPALQVEKWVGEKPAQETNCVLIAFWAPWSLPCRKWIPQWNAWNKKYGSQLLVLGLSAEPEEDILELAGPKIEFACGVDTQARLRTAAGVTSVPTVLLVDSKGLVRYQGHPGALSEAQLQSFFTPAAEPLPPEH